MKPDNHQVATTNTWDLGLTYCQHEEADEDAGIGDQGQESPAHSVHQVETDEGGQEVDRIDPGRDPEYCGDIVTDPRHL